MDTLKDIAAYLISPAVIGGIIVSWLQAQLKAAKAEKEAETKEREKQDIEYRRLVNDYQHATGGVVFWLHKGIENMDKEHRFFNGDFEKSYEEFKKAEHALQEFEQKIFVQHKY